MMVSLSSFSFLFFFHSNLSFLFFSLFIIVRASAGPYNNIQSWNYSLIISAFATNASVYTYKVTTESEAEEALKKVIISALFLFYLLFFRFLTF